MIPAVALLAALAAATPVGVGAREHRFSVYRSVVPVGDVRLVVHDFGEDPHDVQVVGPRGFRSPVFPEVRPGETRRYTVRLRRPGRYTLVCRVANHAALGMKATLRVVRR